MTTNQDGPNTAGAAELKACPLCASGQVTTAPDHEFGDTTWAVICKACWCRVERDLEVDAIAAWNRRAENPTPRPSAVPDEVVEAMIDEFMSKIVVDGNGGLEFLDEALRAALTASIPAIRVQVVAEERGLRDAVAKIMPIRINNGPDYAEVYFSDGQIHSTQAMTMNPQDWEAISASFEQGAHGNG